MKTVFTSLFSLLTVVASFGQQQEKASALTLSVGPGFLNRQDLIFSPFAHSDFSILNVGLDYTREAEFYQKVSLRYANFNPMVTAPYGFTFHGEPETAYPHSFNFIDLDYQFGKQVKGIQNGNLKVGGLFSTDIQATSYVYGRISSFGYYAAIGLGVFGTYEIPINEKSRLSTTLKLPLFAWLARSPYLVNDDEFIENISSHSGFKTFMAYLGDGQLATWNKVQTLDFELKYEYDLSERWGIGAAYLFELIHMSQPRNLLSFRNSLNFSGSYKF
ncbi:hypothetical protein [Algoriphagus terrigena]|uniref:hypothetical protein n=1 Tax=Algoriphagus terrigena TaxID=344884 RepID=UPI00040912A2|nr:hypothetical protein [Algoriphagus terrigena]